MFNALCTKPDNGVDVMLTSEEVIVVLMVMKSGVEGGGGDLY